MIGITDEVVECQRCGKPNLRSTVILEVFDDAGTSAGATYYGSSCAARALASVGVRRTGAQILAEARGAQRVREQERAHAIEWLSFFSLPVSGKAEGAVYTQALAKWTTINGRSIPDPEATFRHFLALRQAAANA